MISSEINPDKKFLYFLGAITLVGLFLRLHGLWSESFTADEVDTLFRIKSSPNLHELLNHWVRHDGHPPFTHLLEYFWTKIFGISEGAIRFPFAILGTAAIWFAGKTTRLWFGTGTAIAVAAGVAFLQFPIMYSQLARPYSPGLFFSMMTVFYWSNYLFNGKYKKSDLIFFVVGATGAAYSHYFSLLLVGLIGMIGLFFLRKENWKLYVTGGIAVILLFVPYIGIFIFQLTAGGVGGPGGWLGKPTPDFFANHLWFIFDESRAILYGAILLSISTAIIFRSRIQKFHVLAFFLFASPLLIGYFYSQKSPVLQNSVLLFSFPFLLMLLFAWIPPIEKWKFAFVIPGSFAFCSLFYVTVYKPFHLTNHFGRLKEIASLSIDWGKQFGEQNISCAYNVDYPYYMEYYWQKFNHTPQQVLTYRNDGKEELLTFKKLVENSNGNYFVYGWSTVYSSLDIIPIIEEKYPFLVKKMEWFNSAIYLFSKKTFQENHVTAIDFSEQFQNDFLSIDDFSPSGIYTVSILDSTKQSAPEAKWSEPCKTQLRDSSLLPTPEQIKRSDSLEKANGPYTYQWTTRPWTPGPYLDYDVRLDSACIYSPLLKMKVGDILKNPDNTILFSTRIKLLDKNSDLVLAIEFQRDGKQLYWNGIESSTQVDTTKIDEWQNVYFGLQLPNDLKLSDTISFVCYTKDGKPILLDFLEVQTFLGHSGIYGPRPNFQ